PAVREVMSRIEVRIDPSWKERAPGGFPCAIVLATADGVDRGVEVPFASGHAHKKMSREQVLDKVYQYVEGGFSSRQAREIASIVDRLDRLASVRELTRLLA